MGVWGSGLLDCDGAMDALDGLADEIDASIMRYHREGDEEGMLALLCVRRDLAESTGVPPPPPATIGRWFQAWGALRNRKTGWFVDADRQDYLAKCAQLWTDLYLAAYDYHTGMAPRDLAATVQRAVHALAAGAPA